MHHTTPRSDRAEIIRALRLIMTTNQVTELRALDAITADDRRPHVETGYFDHAHIEHLAEAVGTIRMAKGIYIVVNPVNPALLARACNRMKAAGRTTLTGDKDIVSRRWLLVDIDPQRPVDISSSDAEHDAALAMAGRIRVDLSAAGWPEPIQADSGNGAHLLYRIDQPAEDDGLVKRCLESLAAKYDTDSLKVDQIVFNPARIWKLFGTLACKGDHTPDRPHRMSRIIHAPESIGVVSVELLETLAAQVSTPEVKPKATTSSTPTNGRFDLDEWITSHNLDLRGPEPWQGGRRWIFSVCPWNADHTNGSAYIVQHASGAIAAGCHHDGCRSRDWHALRDLVEPGWRERRQQHARAAPVWRPGDTTIAAVADTTSTPIVTCLADVEPRAISWLWPGRIPLGRITLLVGRPGEGKSFFTTDAAARISTGTPWPDGSDCPQGSVILISAEDDPADTIRPRLDAHYADCRRVHLLTGVRAGKQERMVTLADVGAIEATLTKLPDCRLIVVDPIGSFLGGGTDAHRDNEVRSVLAPIAQLAERYGPAVLVVAHRRKSLGASADDSALGSRAFTGIARAVWHLSRDSDSKSRRLLLPGKNNLAREGDGLAFTIIGEPARIAWEKDPVAMHADDALAAECAARKPGPEADAQDAAAVWLRAALADGPRMAAELYDEWTNGHGGSKITLKRAKQSVGAEAYRPAVPGPWWWRFRGDQVQGDQVTKERELEPLDTLAKNTGNLALFDGDNSKGLKLADLDPLAKIDTANALLAEAGEVMEWTA